MQLEFITAGQIVNTHGIRGEIKLLPQGVDLDVLADCGTFYIGGRPYSPAARREHKGCLLLKLADVSLPEGEYFDEELIGLTARDAESGEALGKVDEVLSYPAHKIYAVRGGKDEYLIPAVPAFIAGIDVPGGTMDVHMMKGLGTHEN